MVNFATPRTITLSGDAVPMMTLTQSVPGPTGPQTLSASAPMLLVRSLRGEERLSEIYTYELDTITNSEPTLSAQEAASLDLKKMVGNAICISTQIEGQSVYQPAGSVRTNIGSGTREISGIVTRAVYLGPEDRRGRYRLTVRPWVSLLCGRTNYRIFQHLPVDKIISSVLGECGFDFEMRLCNTYPNMDMQVQYGESDFNFIQRLAQEFGIYWFFEHADGRHKMVLVDLITIHRPVKSEAYRTLQYLAPNARVGDAEYISEFNIEQNWAPGIFTTGDYDFKNPGATLAQQKAMVQGTANDRIEHYEWPGDYTSIPGEGNTLVHVRAQEQAAQGPRVFGRGNLRDVECGTMFTLAGHPTQPANGDYVVVAARIEATEIADVSGNASGQYQFTTDFEALSSKTIFRPERTIPKPRTSGPQPAVVTGEAGNEIWTDNFARVKIKFHWDRYNASDETSSCWVRVMWPHSGPEFGHMSLPRVGMEVIVDFVNGDPDRPIVVGQMYRQHEMPPWELPGPNIALTGYRSKELGSIRANALVFDDTNGKIQAQLNSDEGDSGLRLGYITHIDGNRGRTVARGYGAEMRTYGTVTVRAPGIFLTTEHSDATSPVKYMPGTLARLKNALDLQQSLAQLASLNGAQQPSTAAAPADQGEAAKTLQVQNDAIQGNAAASAENPFPELSRPDVVVSSEAGVAVTAADSVHVATNAHMALSAVGHLAVAVGRSVFGSVAGVISLFAKVGIRIISAGKVLIQSNDDEIDMIAQKVLRHISKQRIEAFAPEIVFNADGTQITMNRAGVEVKTMGQFVVHAATHSFVGPASQSVTSPDLPKGAANFNDQYIVKNAVTGDPVGNMKYQIKYATGETISGVTGADGKIPMQNSLDPAGIIIKLLGKQE